MVVRSGVCSPTKNSQNGTNTKQAVNVEFCNKNPQNKTQKNACRAEYPLIINHSIAEPSPTGEESPKQAGPGALFTNTNRLHRAPGHHCI